jgi:lysophospholipase L1-like esterase
VLLGASAACEKASSPTQPAPAPAAPTYTVTATVYYDENGNGSLDVDEVVRLPNVEVDAGGASSRTLRGTGQAVVPGVPGGTQAVAVDAQTLPSFFVPPVPVVVSVPAPAEVRLPVRLPIGDNRPNTYMAFGDDVSIGQGSSDGSGYRVRLESLLGSYFGTAQVVSDGLGGPLSAHGAARILKSVERLKPAYTLIQYGSNDWGLRPCKAVPFAPDCYTLSWLTDIVRGAKARHSLPVIATLIPANSAFQPPERDMWIGAVNVDIKSMAAREGAAVADMNAAFRQAGDVPKLYFDGTHPNDAGYEIMAQTFFRAVSQAPSEVRVSALR